MGRDGEKRGFDDVGDLPFEVMTLAFQRLGANRSPDPDDAFSHPQLGDLREVIWHRITGKGELVRAAIVEMSLDAPVQFLTIAEYADGLRISIDSVYDEVDRILAERLRESLGGEDGGDDRDPPDTLGHLY